MKFSAAVTVLLAFYIVCAPLCAYSVDSCNDFFKMETRSQTSSPPSKLDIIAFIKASKLLSDEELKSLEKSVQAYSFKEENTTDAFLMRVIDAAGDHPNPLTDALYNRYYRSLLLSYLANFKKIINVSDESSLKQIPLLFGLDKNYKNLGIETRTSSRRSILTAYAQLAESVFQRTSSIDLRLANHLLVQMNYMHAFFTGDPLAVSKEAKKSSFRYLEMLDRGQRFLPSPKPWSITNMAAQWFSNANVNMIPLDFGKASQHGGLSSFQAMVHDHEHTYRRNLAIDKMNPYSQQSRFVQKTLDEIIIQAQLDLKSNYQMDFWGSDLTSGVFLFLHEPSALIYFLQTLREGNTNWNIGSKNVNELVKILAATLESEHSNFPELVLPSGHFEEAMQLFISKLGKLALISGLPNQL